MGNLIDGANFVDAFLAMLGNKETSYPREHPLGSGLKGRIADDALPETVLNIVRELREPNDITRVVHGNYCDLFVGDSSSYGNGLSEADFALISHLLNRGLSIKEAELAMRASGRYRSKWDEPRGQLTWLEYSIRRANVNKGPVGNGTVEKDSYGDIHNARLLAQTFRGRLVYNVTKRKWMRWCDKKEQWHECDLGEEIDAAKQIAQKLIDKAKEALDSGQEAGGKALMKHAVRSHDKARLDAMISLAASEPDMSIRQTDLDKQKHLLGVKNGVANLRTGELIPNTPDLLITRYCSVNYVPDARGKKWPDFLAQIMLDEAKTIETLQRILGCTLTAATIEEILVIWYGFGANGKSVLANLIRYILGDYAVTAPPSLMSARRQGDNSPRNDVAALAGARAAFINELSSDETLDEQTVKQLAGREPISARFLNKEFFEFEPTFTPILRTNHKPIIRGSDDGIWRRIVLIPFRAQFTGDRCNPNVEEELREEAEAILAWMVQGAIKWFKDGLYLSPTVKREVAEYRSDSDVLGQFLEEKCSLSDPVAEVEQQSMYSAWKFWCESNGHYRTTKSTLTRRLKERGVSDRKSGAKRFYTGISLL
jgi:putative DNA primase/helicase